MSSGRVSIDNDSAGGHTARLTRGIDIRRVLSQGQRLPGRRMVVYVLPGEQRTRVGFLSGRRVGGAVGRNRARRIVREAWRACAPRAREGFEIVFVARPEILGAKTQDLIAEMTETLAAAGVTEA